MYKNINEMKMIYKQIIIDQRDKHTLHEYSKPAVMNYS